MQNITTKVHSSPLYTMYKSFDLYPLLCARTHTHTYRLNIISNGFSFLQTCLLLVIFGIILLIVIIVLAVWSEDFDMGKREPKLFISLWFKMLFKAPYSILVVLIHESLLMLEKTWSFICCGGWGVDGGHVREGLSSLFVNLVLCVQLCVSAV